jgi:hypothetical protein
MMTIYKNISLFTLCMMIALLALSVQSRAQDGLLPSQSNAEMSEKDLASSTHPILRMTPDKSTILNLERPAERVIIGNDAHINVFMDTPTRLIVVSRQPGATHLTLLGEQGEIVMQRHVIVASPQQDYVRVRRNCALATGDCADTEVFYCPGMCHEIMVKDGSEDGGGSSSVIGGFSGGDAAQIMGAENPDPPPPE